LSFLWNCWCDHYFYAGELAKGISDTFYIRGTYSLKTPLELIPEAIRRPFCVFQLTIGGTVPEVSAYLHIFAHVLSIYLWMYLSIHLFIYLSISLSHSLCDYLTHYVTISLSISLAHYLTHYLTMHSFFYLYYYVTLYLTIYLSHYLSIFSLSLYLSFSLSLYLSIYLFHYRSTFLVSIVFYRYPFHASFVSLEILLSIPTLWWCRLCHLRWESDMRDWSTKVLPCSVKALSLTRYTLHAFFSWQIT
jgi:hypothetical protein